MRLHSRAQRSFWPRNGFRRIPRLVSSARAQWLLARVAFGERPPAPVPAAATSLAEMIVPLAIFTAENGSVPRIDRSEHYLVDELANVYERLQKEAYMAGLAR